jgi:hypothetical protein
MTRVKINSDFGFGNWDLIKFMDQYKTKTQLIWGVALVLAGLGVIYRIPQVIPRIVQFEQFRVGIGFVYFCAYFLALALIFGGGKKIYGFFRRTDNKNSDN